MKELKEGVENKEEKNLGDLGILPQNELNSMPQANASMKLLKIIQDSAMTNFFGKNIYSDIVTNI